MRQVLTRMAVSLVAVTIAFLVIPFALVLVWLATRSQAQLHEAAESWHRLSTILWVIGAILALSATALGTAFWVASKRGRELSKPLDELGHRAERLGIGETRLAPVSYGIAEIDRLARALAKGSEQASRRLSAEREFAADASHQLRTPLTALLMRLEEIASTDDLDVIAEEATIAIGQVERLSTTVSDLMARNRSGEDMSEGVSLDSVLAALQREWQPAFAAARRSIGVHGERGLRVRATPVALAQILSTLFENSLAHGRGTVSVSGRRVGPSVVIEVSDQGAGIDPAMGARIFERRVSSSGSGLGLTLARDLAQSSGGRLELVSPIGAEFALFLSAMD